MNRHKCLAEQAKPIQEQKGAVQRTNDGSEARVD